MTTLINLFGDIKCDFAMVKEPVCDKIDLESS